MRAAWIIPIGFFAGVGFLYEALEIAHSQYINGPAPPVTAGQFCAEFRGWVGISRAGHTLRSVSCAGGGHDFTVRVRID